MNLPPDFQTMLDVYKNNYAAYKVTGNVGYRASYESALKWINQVIAMENASLARDASQIQSFMSSYDESNSEVTNLDKKLKTIKTQGPKLQGEYERTKRMNEKQIEAIDNTYMYVKGSIVVGLLIIVGIAGAL